MSVHRRPRRDGSLAWRVRWQEGERWRSRTFDLKRDALLFDGEVRRLRQLGSLAALDAGSQTLDAYVANTWTPIHAPLLAVKTRTLYAGLYDTHISPTLGSTQLRQITTEQIARWQSDRLAAGAGPIAVSKALTFLGNVLQRAFEGGHLAVNPQRRVRRAPRPKRTEVRPLAPSTVETMRAASSPRDAMIISVLAYAGLRPEEAFGLQWGDIRERTLLVERAISLGSEKDTKTTAHRTVRLLAPLAYDLHEFRMLSGRPDDRDWIFPSRVSRPWSESAYASWRRKAFRRALDAAGLVSSGTHTFSERSCPRCKALAGRPCRTPSGAMSKRPHADRRVGKARARPYDLRHSFASLLLHEGRSVVYVARQLGHEASLTLSTYGHVIDELEDAPQQDAEAAISAARETHTAPQLPKAAQ